MAVMKRTVYENSHTTNLVNVLLSAAAVKDMLCQLAAKDTLVKVKMEDITQTENIVVQLELADFYFSFIIINY